MYDQSGINTVGNGIGHDITAVLDGNTANPYILNDFYEAEKDDFTRGKIRFPLYDLEEGEHSLTLKVWDVFNLSKILKDLNIENIFIYYPSQRYFWACKLDGIKNVYKYNFKKKNLKLVAAAK